MATDTGKLKYYCWKPN